MLLQLEGAQKENVEKLLAFAEENNLKLSLIDNENNYVLPGKPLTAEQLKQLIKTSRDSSIIKMATTL